MTDKERLDDLLKRWPWSNPGRDLDSDIDFVVGLAWRALVAEERLRIILNDAAVDSDRDAALVAATTARTVQDVVNEIMAGHFLHDDAPPKRFAREVCAMLGRKYNLTEYPK